MDQARGAYVLGSDIGTSGCKSIVLDAAGQIRGWAIADYPTARPRPGWAEQHPEDWFNAFCSTVRQSIEQAGVDPADLAMVGIVGITHNAVLLDEAGNVLRPSIIYLDTRSDPQCKTLLAQWNNEVFCRTWNQISPIWTWPQLLWIRENEPDVWGKVRHILFPKDYVRHRIAPSLVTDTIDAVGTLLYDPMAGAWIDDFCAALGLPLSAFPPAHPSGVVVGRISAEGARATGLTPGTRIITGTTDTAAEVFGTGATCPGQTIVKLATVGRIMAITDQPVMDPAFLNYPHVLDGLWYPGTSTKFAASAFTWARRVFWGEDDEAGDYEAMDTAASAVPPGADGLLFHPYLAGEFAPMWDPHLQASFVGVSIHHRRAHFTRAVMEGVGFAIRDAIESVQNLLPDIQEIRLIGGGAASNVWAQIITDILQRDVLIPKGADAAFGAALLAGVAAGLYDSSRAFLDRVVRVRKSLSPDADRARLYTALFEIYRDASRALQPISHRLTAFENPPANPAKERET